MNNDTELQLVKKSKIAIKHPDKFKVILFNDDFTSFEFVEKVLTDIYNKTLSEANAISKLIHKEGNAVVGIYIKEIAVIKKKQTDENAERYEFPLKTEIVQI